MRRLTIQSWIMMAVGLIFSALAIRDLFRLQDWRLLACIIAIDVVWPLVAFDFYWKFRHAGQGKRNLNYKAMYGVMFAGFICNLAVHLMR